jgi:hypothetical protein
MNIKVRIERGFDVVARSDPDGQVPRSPVEAPRRAWR